MFHRSGEIEQTSLIAEFREKEILLSIEDHICHWLVVNDLKYIEKGSFRSHLLRVLSIMGVGPYQMLSLHLLI